MDGPVQDHGRPKLCGNNVSFFLIFTPSKQFHTTITHIIIIRTLLFQVPDGTSFESKYNTLILKFVSNGRRRKSGFKAKIVAI